MVNPKVFITQFMPQLNYQETEQFGDEVIFLTDREYRPEPTPPGYNDTIIQEIQSKMISYVPGLDYIVVTGSSIPNMIVGTLLAKRPGEHKILKWSNKRRSYDLHIYRT